IFVQSDSWKNGDVSDSPTLFAQTYPAHVPGRPQFLADLNSSCLTDLNSSPLADLNYPITSLPDLNLTSICRPPPRTFLADLNLADPFQNSPRAMSSTRSCTLRPSFIMRTNTVVRPVGVSPTICAPRSSKCWLHSWCLGSKRCSISPVF